jgi:hypothetical protein
MLKSWQDKDKIERRKELPCIRSSSWLYRYRIGRGAVPMSMERKKVMKEQRRSKEQC